MAAVQKLKNFLCLTSKSPLQKPVIYYWKPRDGNTGHISMKVSSKLYVSFWPINDYIFDLNDLTISVKSTKNSYEQDCWTCNGTKRIPDEQIEINAEMNVGAVRKWWKMYRNSGFSATRNSCWAVKEAIIVGITDRDELKRLMQQLDKWQEQLAKGMVKHNVKRRVKKCPLPLEDS